METDRHAVPRLSHGLSLRGVLLVVLSAMTIYATVMMVFLSFQVVRVATSVGKGLEPERFLFEEVVSHVHVLNGATYSINRLLSEAIPDSGRIARLRTDLVEYTTSHHFPPLGEMPPDARESIVLATGNARRLEVTIFEVLDLLELGRIDAAATRVRDIDSLRVVYDAHLTQAQVQGMRDLRARQATLMKSANQTLVVLAAWLVIGLVGIPVIWVIARRRIWQPLSQLEAGLAQVARGDLHVEVPVPRFDEVGRLGNHFNAMTDVLRQRAEEQGRFAAAGQLIAGVAHEVNNPLMAIAAMSETRLDDPTLTTDQRAELKHIVRQARRAGRLLSGLLRFVRSDESGVDTTSLNDVCQDALDLVSYRFGHEEVTLETRMDQQLPMAQGDPGRIEQVLVNLFSNALDALQAVDPPRRLTVSSYTEGTCVYVAVEDNGPGVPRDISRRLFHPFTSTKGKQGTGLGLYISRQILRDLDGDLVHQDIQQGSRFIVSMPIAIGPTEQDLTVSPIGLAHPRQSLEGMRVLLVDDEDSIRRPLSRFLAGRGATVIQAADGFEALKALEESEVDVILADLRMPRMDGVKMYGELLTRWPDLATRTIFLTGDLTQMKERPGTSIDPDRVLIKPVKLAEVESRLRDVWLSAPSDPPG
ncbi:MAG: hybrid sensor histidine kinase/response regulator [Gemmatimonadales bacterium]